ncbi:DUF5131 family protein [Marinobacter shengliensis]|uniref:DUF5131 family protein n=1 Tax=Marinobacter shengliensis TaxID=1389223 RepID=UPI001108F35C|nr:phage Gp37/Gp68 family protein [Marinobacter shengliensis]
MGKTTNIEWTDATWNPIRGCSRVSEACRNCYAETVAKRFSGDGQPYEGLIARTGQWNGRVSFIDHKLDEPLRWQKPRMVFVNSMSDLFHESLTNEQIAAVFGVMAAAPRHTFQILTKRPARLREWFRWHANEVRARDLRFEPWRICEAEAQEYIPDLSAAGTGAPWPLPNVWIGVSVEDQKTADERIPLLLDTPAAVRWISAEPLLGEICLQGIAPGETQEQGKRRQYLASGDPEQQPRGNGSGFIDWVVAGGESGAKARPMHPEWVRTLRDQCSAAGVPFLFKQWGEWAPEIECATETGAESALYMEVDGTTRAARYGARNGAVTIQRNGKKATGRRLDGRLLDGYPS